VRGVENQARWASGELLLYSGRRTVPVGANPARFPPDLLLLFTPLCCLCFLIGMQTFERWSEEFYAFVGVYKFAKLFSLVVFLSHWICCLWYFVGTEPAYFVPAPD
jgi:hypothetical protein